MQKLSHADDLRRITHWTVDVYRSHSFQAKLTAFNSARLAPATIGEDWQADIEREVELRVAEGHFLELERGQIAELAADVPTSADAFMAWFEALRDNAPGQNDPLFPWLSGVASMEEMRWFLTQEAAGEAGFEDLVAMTQVKLPHRPKLEMARNFWDEMGRGHERGMHGPMLATVVTELGLDPTVMNTCWQSLALANLMVGLAANRRYVYQAIGALGAIEMTAPGRVSLVNDGLRRLQVPTSARKYFQLHAGLDIQHSKDWNAEVIYPLVAADPDIAKPIAEGALMRLNAGARCFEEYRRHFAVAMHADATFRVAA